MTAAPAGAFDELARIGVVPVVEIEDARDAVPLARALNAGGIHTMEITLRTDAAIHAIRRVAGEVEGFVVGAGTLLTAENIREAKSAGAAYGVAPGFHPALSEAAAEADLPFVPGVVTPSEVFAALALGHHRLKFFPANQYGGVSTLRAFAGPFGAADVAFMPTGGVTAENLVEYLSLPHVFAVGGTWIAPRRAIVGGAFEAITRASRAAQKIRATIPGAPRPR